MKMVSLTKIYLFFSLIILASFTLDKGKKKKTNSSKATVTKKVAVTTKATKGRYAVLSNKPKAVVTTKEENPYYIIVDKSDYELKVYDEEGWYATYPIVFGSKDLSDKMKEGDKKTPDGQFKIILKKIHPKWGPELLLDYPNPISYQRFKDRKAKGIISKSAKIGDGIAIHATRPEEEWTVDNFYNWTDGCVSVKYTEMKDLYSYIPVGTPVTIQQ